MCLTTEASVLARAPHGASSARGTTASTPTPRLRAWRVEGDAPVLTRLHHEQGAGRVVLEHLGRELDRSVACDDRELPPVAAFRAHPAVADRHRAAKPL